MMKLEDFPDEALHQAEKGARRRLMSLASEAGVDWPYQVRISKEHTGLRVNGSAVIIGAMEFISGDVEDVLQRTFDLAQGTKRRQQQTKIEVKAKEQEVRLLLSRLNALTGERRFLRAVLALDLMDGGEV